MPAVIIGAAGFIIFLLPVFSGVLNAGNIGGMFIFTLIFLGGLFRSRITMFIKTPPGKIIAGAVLLILVCGICIGLAESVLMIKTALNAPSGNTSLVVLGCKVNGEAPSQMLMGRIETAEKYMKENPLSKAVLSGGKGPDEGISEAQCMYNVLTERGISPDRLYIEDKSTSTEENIKFSSEIIKRNNLPCKITVVTNDFHLYRACLTAEKQGTESFSLPAKTPPLFFPTYVMREYAGILVQWLKG